MVYKRIRVWRDKVPNSASETALREKTERWQNIHKKITVEEARELLVAVIQKKERSVYVNWRYVLSRMISSLFSVPFLVLL